MDRACGRVLQMLGHRQHGDGPRAEQETALVAELTACRELVWQCCTEAVARDPSASSDVPADDDLAAAHRALSRTATSCAQAAQAVVMSEDLASAERAVRAAAARAGEAAAALRLPDAGPR